MFDATRRPNLLASFAGRRALFAALYFSEGAPIGYIWWALPTRLRAADVPVEQVTAITSLLVLPWALKFLWAPLVDTVRTPRWTLRSWIISMQLAMGLLLLPILFLDLAADRNAVLVFLMLHAFAAATQDASVDALCVQSVPGQERGRMNGWMQCGMLGGRAIFGGLSLAAERYLGPAGVVVMLVLCVWCSTLLVALFARELALPVALSSGGADVSPGRALLWRAHAFTATLSTVLRKPRTWLGLAFGAVGGVAFESAGAVAGPMLTDHGADTETVGWFFAIPVVGGMVTGALVGGFLADRFGRKLTVAALALAMGANLFLLSLLGAGEGGPLAPVIVAMSLMYLLAGAFTASSYALFMDLTDPRLGATEFSAFMAATNVCEMGSARLAGKLSGSLGYPAAFAAIAPLTLVGMVIVLLIRLPRAAPARAPNGD